MFFQRHVSALLLIASSLVITGCAHTPPPRIKTELFQKPATVAIVESPPLRNVALIDPFAGSFNHFTFASDRFYIIGPDPEGNMPLNVPDMVGQSTVYVQGATNTQIAGGMVAGLAVGALIQASADSTMRKAQSYHQDVMKAVPTLNLKADVITALRSALESQSIATSIVPGGSTTMPRLRWTNDLDAGMYPYAADRNAPTVDADLLVQVSPAAFWYAPGPLNNFRRSVSIGVAVFNGRTKEFLGKQDFVYSTSAFRGEYNTYGGLLDDSVAATALLRESLLSLVPQVADTIGKRVAAAPGK